MNCAGLFVVAMLFSSFGRRNRWDPCALPRGVMTANKPPIERSAAGRRTLRFRQQHSGSKLMSRAGLVSSLSTWSIVNVPASICCRSGGRGASRQQSDLRADYSDDQMPLQRVRTNTRDQRIEQVIFTRLAGVYVVARLERLSGTMDQRTGTTTPLTEIGGRRSGCYMCCSRIRTRPDDSDQRIALADLEVFRQKAFIAAGSGFPSPDPALTPATDHETLEPC